MGSVDVMVLWLLVMIACFVAAIIGGGIVVLSFFYELDIWRTYGFILLIAGLSPFLYWFLKDRRRHG